MEDDSVGCIVASECDIRKEFNKCKAEVSNDINSTKSELISLRAEVHNLRTDVHGIREGVNTMSSSLEIIAHSMSKLTDFPETWEKLKGFWAVVNWLKNNIIPLSLIVGIFIYAITHNLIS